MWLYHVSCSVNFLQYSSPQWPKQTNYVKCSSGLWYETSGLYVTPAAKCDKCHVLFKPMLILRWRKQNESLFFIDRRKKY